MTLPTTSVQGIVRDPAGNPLPGASLTFQLSAATRDLSSNSAVLSVPIVAVAGSDGAVSVDLWPNGNGFENTHYIVSAEAVVGGSDQRFSFGNIQVPLVGPVDLANLLSQPVALGLTVEQQVLAAAASAKADAAAAAASAAAVDMPALQGRVDTFINGAKSFFPVTPNLLGDTRNFDKFCGGQKKVEQPLLSALEAPWSGAFVGGVGTATAEVVHWQDFVAKGIPTGGDLAVMEGDLPSAVDFCALVLDVTNPEGVITKFAQANAPAIGRNAGQHKSQTSLFAVVLEGSGEAALDFGINHAAVAVDQAATGQGWRHYRGMDGVGYRWSELWARIHGTGRLRVAIALPYLGFGDHGGVPIWAASAGPYHTGDVS